METKQNFMEVHIMSRQICEVNARNKEEALMALELLKEKIEKIPYAQHMEPVYETAVVTNAGKA